MNEQQLGKSSGPGPVLSRNRSRFHALWRWFWIANLAIGLYFAWYCFYVPSNDIDWSVDFASAQQKSARTEKPMMLFFTGKWCVPCRIMKRTVWADEQVRDTVNAAFCPVTIDIDDPSTAETVARYGVLGSPVMIVTDPRGNVLKWKDGGMSKTEFLEWVGNVDRPAADRMP